MLMTKIPAIKTGLNPKGYTYKDKLSGDQGMYGINATDNTRYYVLLNTNKGFALNNIFHPNFGTPIPRP